MLFVIVQRMAFVAVHMQSPPIKHCHDFTK